MDVLREDTLNWDTL